MYYKQEPLGKRYTNVVLSVDPNCFACGTSMESEGVYLHYLYNVWICHKCYFNSEDREIDFLNLPDWDGVHHQEMCDWCSDEDMGSKMMHCTTCQSATCIKCLTHIFGQPKVLRYEREGSYRCCRCDKEVLAALVEDGGWPLPKVKLRLDMLPDRPWRTVKEVTYRSLRALFPSTNEAASGNVEEEAPSGDVNEEALNIAEKDVPALRKRHHNGRFKKERNKA